MKKAFSVFATIFTVAVLASCQKDINPEIQDTISVTATLESKVTITDNGDKTLTPAWELNDVIIGIVNGNASNKVAFTVNQILGDGTAILTTTSSLKDGDVVKVMYAKGVSSTDVIDANGKVAVELNMSANLNNIKAIMCAEATVSNKSLALPFINKMAIVGISLSGIDSGSSVVRTALYGDDIYNKVSVDLAAGTVTGTEWGDIACEETIGLTSGTMNQKVYTAILPAKEFNAVAKTNQFRCYRYSNTLANAISVGKYSRISDKTATEFYVFSCNATGRVAEFAPGNLQYVHGTGFRFAESQQTVLRGTSGNIKNNSYANGDVIDLFSFSINNTYGINVYNRYTINGECYDWGKNFHRNWTTPAQSDWAYVTTPRNGETWRFAYVKVDNIEGLLIRGDRSTATAPEGANVGGGAGAAKKDYVAVSGIPEGCIFLPCGYFRGINGSAARVFTSTDTNDGGYWSSDFYGAITIMPGGTQYYVAYMLNFTQVQWKNNHQSSTSDGASVRLVHIF